MPLRGQLRRPDTPQECPAEIADLIDACKQCRRLRPLVSSVAWLCGLVQLGCPDCSMQMVLCGPILPSIQL